MLKSPYTYFGGKSKTAAMSWRYLGDVDNYVEPFFGSGATLLARPSNHNGGVETVNDLDKYIANFWRSVSKEPDAVAEWADWPINEVDMTSRHIWLVNEGRKRIANLEADPDAYDVKVAGWWIWGINLWIGGGWCSGHGAWTAQDGKLIHMNGKFSKRRTNAIDRKRPHLSGIGVGINRSGKDGFESVYDYMQSLYDRMKKVRVCSGDWSRIVTESALGHGAAAGIFLDPPYDLAIRDKNCYNNDRIGISFEVRKWCIDNGENPRYRIALCGYEGEHPMPGNWTKMAWTGGNAYATATSANKTNRKLERIWFSPNCIQQGLFDLAFDDLAAAEEDDGASTEVNIEEEKE